MPAMWTVPEVGNTRVVHMLMVVVLPAPLGPSRLVEFALADTEFDAIHGDYALFAFVDFTKTPNLDN